VHRKWLWMIRNGDEFALGFGPQSAIPELMKE